MTVRFFFTQALLVTLSEERAMFLPFESNTLVHQCKARKDCLLDGEPDFPCLNRPNLSTLINALTGSRSAPDRARGTNRPDYDQFHVFGI